MHGGSVLTPTVYSHHLRPPYGQKGKRVRKVRGYEGNRGRLTGRDTLDASSTCQATDVGFDYALDFVGIVYSVDALGAAHAEELASFSAYGG